MITSRGSIGTNDNDIIVEDTFLALTNYYEHVIRVIAGTVIVEGTMDGENWSIDLFVVDEHVAAPNTNKVGTMTGAGKLFHLHGRFKGLRLRQDGATPSNADITHVETENP